MDTITPDKIAAMQEYVKQPGSRKEFYDDQSARGMGHNAIIEQLIRIDEEAKDEQLAAEERRAAAEPPKPPPRAWRWFETGTATMMGGTLSDKDTTPPKVEEFLSEFSDFARQDAFQQFRDAGAYTVFAGWRAFLFLKKTLKDTGLNVVFTTRFMSDKFEFKVTNKHT